MTRALTDGVAVSEHSNLLRKDGYMLPVLLTASPIILNGKPIGAIEIFRDLTRERELDIAKDEFVSIASHQLRTPATSIRGILSMVLNGDFGPLSAKQERYIQLAAISNDRQLDIIEDLLSIAQVDAGRMDLSLAEVDLSKLIAQILPHHDIMLSRANQSLTSSLEPNVIAFADSEKIKMVVDNLISNAIKYTKSEGAIEVSLYTKEGYAQICVRDNDVGIPADKVAAIFTKFARVDNELSTPGGGTGLGLYLAKKIANLHRGNITVTSQVGQGSFFCFTLPLRKKN
jgi:signal transduction histidine kinase